MIQSMMTLNGQLYIYPETSVSFVAIYSITFSYSLISSILFYSSFSSKGMVLFFFTFGLFAWGY